MFVLSSDSHSVDRRIYYVRANGFMIGRFSTLMTPLYVDSSNLTLSLIFHTARNLFSSTVFSMVVQPSLDHRVCSIIFRSRFVRSEVRDRSMPADDTWYASLLNTRPNHRELKCTVPRFTWNDRCITLHYRPSCSSLLLRVLFKLVWDEQYIPIIVDGSLRNLLQLL